MSAAWRIGLWLLCLACLAYAGICAYLLIEQNKLLYIGTALPPHPPGLALTPFNDASGAQIGWVAQPAGMARGTVVFFHGNDEEAWSADQNYAPYFTARGWRVVFPEYRGFDMRADLAPTHDMVIADAVVDLQLAQHDWPRGKFWVAGNSLGAGIAAEAAGRDAAAQAAGTDIAQAAGEDAAQAAPEGREGGAQRVLLFVPWDRMSAVAAERYPFIPTRLLLWLDGTDYDSCAALAGMADEVFVIYAGQDNIIPAHHARHLAACLSLQPAHILGLPHATHLDWYQQLSPAQWDNLLLSP